MTTVNYPERIKKLNTIIENCRLCPHFCEINRAKGEKGICKLDDNLLVSSAQLHFGEEPPLVGRSLPWSRRGGSGTIFFSGCNLKCIFCQNYSISHFRKGVKITPEKLCHYMLDLADRGAHNINLVTPTPQIHKIVEAIYLAKERGLTLPIVYNCGGYEAVETLRLLEGIIDIYMPDLKYDNEKLSKEFSKAEDYPLKAALALKEMHRQLGDLVINDEGIAVRGLLIRHLVLPNNLAGSKEALTFIADEISPGSYVNVMGQYHPAYKAYEFKELNRRVSLMEIREAVDFARSLGLDRGLEY